MSDEKYIIYQAKEYYNNWKSNKSDENMKMAFYFLLGVRTCFSHESEIYKLVDGYIAEIIN